MAKRKSWEQLSPAYRTRLERKGITAEQHSGGSSLHVARGHISKEREYADTRYRRMVREFADRQAAYYYRDADEVLEQLRSMPRADVEDILSRQHKAEYEYEEEAQKSPEFWESRDHDYPEWLYYYHGVFA